ncbi:MAG: RNA polymerase sigma factor [Bacteroidota bacterium]
MFFKSKISPDELSQKSDTELYILLCGEKRIARAAFSLLYDRHSARVYSYCRRILQNPATAEDIVQEVFAKLFEQSCAKAEMTNIAGFLIRVARNLCLNEKEKKYNQHISLEEFHLSSQANEVERSELLKMIGAALETLPEAERESFSLKEFDGLNYTEISKILNITEQNVRIRVFRGKQKLREILSPYLHDSR